MTIANTFSDKEQEAITAELEQAMQPVKIDDTQFSYGSHLVDTFLTPQATKIVAISGKDLSKTFTDNPQVISLVGQYMAKAQRQEYDYKTKRDFIKAAVSDRLRTQSIAETGKAFSETRIESEMRRDMSFLQVSAAYAACMEVRSSMEALFAAARRRGQDMQYLADKESAEMRVKSSYTAKE